MTNNFFAQALEILMLEDAQEKCREVKKLTIKSPLDISESFPVKRILVPGRPAKPKLVPLQALPKRGSKKIGLLHTIHAIAHIEFNAINLALDALYRFQNMPLRYYQDWLLVAQEEAKHFLLLENYLKKLGYAYGDFVGHDGLWQMVLKTDFDVLVRMALVPRVLEARGLDVTPQIKNKFIASCFEEMVDILTIIFNDEIGHVAIGSYWFNYCCQQRGLDPATAFEKLIKKHFAEKLRPPFNLPARRRAGFCDEELAFLTQSH